MDEAAPGCVGVANFAQNRTKAKAKTCQRLVKLVANSKSPSNTQTGESLALGFDFSRNPSHPQFRRTPRSDSTNRTGASLSRLVSLCLLRSPVVDSVCTTLENLLYRSRISRTPLGA